MRWFNIAPIALGILLMACGSTAVQMQDALKDGAPDEAATIGREWLKNWPEQRNTPEGELIRRLTAEAGFEAAKQRGGTDDFEAFRRTFSNERLAKDLVQQSLELEARAVLDGLISTGTGSTTRLEAFVRRYPQSAAAKEAQHLLAAQAWSNILLSPTAAAVREFRRTYAAVLPAGDPLLSDAKKAEPKFAYQEAKGAQTVAALREFQGRYAQDESAQPWLEKSREDELELAFRLAGSAKSVERWRSFIADYERNPAAAGRVTEARNQLEVVALAAALKMGFAGLERFALEFPGERAAEKLQGAIAIETKRLVDFFLVGNGLTEEASETLMAQAKRWPAAAATLASLAPQIRARAIELASAPGLYLAKSLQGAAQDPELDTALETALWNLARGSDDELTMRRFLAVSQDPARKLEIEQRLGTQQAINAATGSPLRTNIESMKLGQRRSALTVRMEHTLGIPALGITTGQVIVRAQEKAVSGLKVTAASEDEDAEIVLVVDPAHLREANISGLSEELIKMESRLVLAGMPWKFSAYSATHLEGEVVAGATDQRVVASRIGMLWDECDDCEEEEDGQVTDDLTAVTLRGIGSFRNKSRRLLILGTNELRAAQQGLASLEGRADNGLCYTDAKVEICLEGAMSPAETANCARLTNKIPEMVPLIAQMDECVQRLNSAQCVTSTLERFGELAASCGSSRPLDRRQRGLLAEKIKRSGAAVVLLSERGSTEIETFREALEELDVAATVAHTADDLAKQMKVIAHEWTERYVIGFDGPTDLQDDEIEIAVLPRSILAPMSAGVPRKAVAMFGSRTPAGCSQAQLVTKEGEVATGDNCQPSWDFSERVVPEGESLVRVERAGGRRFAVSARGELFVSDDGDAGVTKVEGVKDVTELAVTEGGAYLVATNGQDRPIVAFLEGLESAPRWMEEIPGATKSSDVALVSLPSEARAQLCVTRTRKDRLCRDLDGSWNEDSSEQRAALPAARNMRWLQSGGPTPTQFSQATNGQVQRSRDLGRSWSRIGERARLTGSLRREAASGRLCAISSGKAVCSADDGTTWAEVPVLGEEPILALDLNGGELVASSANRMMNEFEIITELTPNPRQVLDPTTGALLPGVSNALSEMFAKPMTDHHSEIFVLLPAGSGASEVDARRAGNAIAAWFADQTSATDDRIHIVEAQKSSSARKLIVLLGRRR
jgi:hypothetical protein